MKKTVAEHLCKKDFDAALCQQFDIHLFLLQRLNITHRRAIDALADHHLLAGEWPMHFRHINQIPGRKVATQLGGICGFSLQVELAMNNPVVFIDDFDRPQTAATA